MLVYKTHEYCSCNDHKPYTAVGAICTAPHFFCIHILGNNRTSPVARNRFSHSHGQLDSGKLLIIKAVTLLGFAKITIQRVHHTSKAMVH